MENEEEILKGNPFGPNGTLTDGITNMRAAGLVAWELRKLREAIEELHKPTHTVKVQIDAEAVREIVNQHIERWQDDLLEAALALYRYDQTLTPTDRVGWEHAGRDIRQQYMQRAQAVKEQLPKA